MAKTQSAGQNGAFDLAPFAAMFDPKQFNTDAFTKAFAGNTFDFAALAQSQQKTFEVFAAAQNLWMEGAQVVGKRQAEWAREALDEGTQALSKIAAAGTPAEKIMTQLEVAKSTYEKSLATAEEFGKISAETNQKAGQMIAERVFESFDEVAKQVDTSKTAKAA